MSETRATIRTRVRRVVGTAIDATVNQAIKDAHEHLQRKHNYADMETTSTITIAAEATTFTLPSDFKAIVNPEMSNDDGTEYRRMKGIIKDGIESRDPSDEGRPLLFRIWKGVGQLYAKADQAYTFNLEYYRWLPQPPTNDAVYSADDQAQNFLNDTQRYLVLKGQEEGFRRKGHEKRADKYELRARRQRIDLQNDDIENALAGIDLKMEMPG